MRINECEETEEGRTTQGYTRYVHPKGREKRKKDKPKEEPKEEAN